MANKAVVGNIPRGLAPDLARFLQEMREQVQIQGGKGRGNPLDRAITYRDLKADVGTTNLKGFRDLIASQGTGDTQLYGDAFPTAPTGVEVLPTFTNVLVKWDRVPNNWYKITEVFRVTALLNTDDPDNPYPYLEENRVPFFSDAVQVASTISPFFADDLPPGTTAVYWVRHLNRDDQAGPLHDASGTWGTTLRTPLEVLKEYSAEIYQSDGYAWLRSELGEVDAINRAMVGAGFDSGMSKLLANGASVDDILAEQSIAAALDKHTQRTEIKAQFGKNYARLSGGIHAAVNADEAYVQRISALESQWVNDLGTVITSAIDTRESALTSPSGAIATQLSNLTVSYEGTDVSLEKLGEAVAANELQHARWGVKTTVSSEDGSVKRGGVAFNNDGEMTSFLVDAELFAITNGDEEELAPFVVKDGLVVMKEALIDHAGIYTLIADNVTAKTIVATASLTSPVISGGSITGTTLDVVGTGGKSMSVNAQGFLKAEGAEFKSITIKDATGDVIMSSSGLADTYIETLMGEDATFSGTVYANNIEGDVMDAVVKTSINTSTGDTGEFVEPCVSFKLTSLPFHRNVFIPAIPIEISVGGGNSQPSSYTMILRRAPLTGPLEYIEVARSTEIFSNVSQDYMSRDTFSSIIYEVGNGVSGFYQVGIVRTSGGSGQATTGIQDIVVQAFKKGSSLS